MQCSERKQGGKVNAAKPLRRSCKGNGGFEPAAVRTWLDSVSVGIEKIGDFFDDRQAEAGAGRTRSLPREKRRRTASSFSGANAGTVVFDLEADRSRYPATMRTVTSAPLPA